MAPVLQTAISHRGHGGMAGEPANTGYTRALIAPGVAFSHPDGWKLYADLEMPVWQHVTGNQLVAPVAFKFIVSHAF